MLAKLGVTSIDSNLATAIRTSVILVFTWAIVAASYKTLSPLKVAGGA